MFKIGVNTWIATSHITGVTRTGSLYEIFLTDGRSFPNLTLTEIKDLRSIFGL